jgi:hypothetical protein
MDNIHNTPTNNNTTKQPSTSTSQRSVDDNNANSETLTYVEIVNTYHTGLRNSLLLISISFFMLSFVIKTKLKGFNKLLIVVSSMSMLIISIIINFFNLEILSKYDIHFPDLHRLFYLSVFVLFFQFLVFIFHISLFRTSIY